MGSPESGFAMVGRGLPTPAPTTEPDARTYARREAERKTGAGLP